MNDAFYAGIRRSADGGARVKRLEKADALLRQLTPVQLNVVQDPSPRVALLTPGQAGKSTVCGRLIVDTFLRKRQPLIAYVSLTQKVAKRYLWEPLTQLNADHGLGLEPHNTDGYFRSPDGGQCFFGGIESAADVERYRGTPWDLFIVDETKSADQRLVRVLIEEVLPPRLANRNGKLVIAGTPGAILHGTFFEKTSRAARAIEGGHATSRPYRERLDPKWEGIPFEWSLHTWSLAENAARPDLWVKALEEKRRKGWSDTNPIWLREYMGEWVADDTNRLYRFNPDTGLWQPRAGAPLFGLPPEHDWYFVIGVDFGHSDPFAVEILAYSDTHPDLFQAWEYNQAGLSIREQAGVIKRAQDLCGERLVAVVGDPARRHILVSLRRDHGIFVREADKRDKRDAVEMASADFYEGRIKLLKDRVLHEQVATLQWDESGTLDIGGRNDCSDAFLYAHRHVQHRLAKTKAPPPAPGTPEHTAALDEAELAAIAAQERRELDDDFDGEAGQVADVDWEDEW